MPLTCSFRPIQSRAGARSNDSSNAWSGLSGLVRRAVSRPYTTLARPTRGRIRAGYTAARLAVIVGLAWDLELAWSTTNKEVTMLVDHMFSRSLATLSTIVTIAVGGAVTAAPATARAETGSQIVMSA